MAEANLTSRPYLELGVSPACDCTEVLARTFPDKRTKGHACYNEFVDVASGNYVRISSHEGRNLAATKGSPLVRNFNKSRRGQRITSPVNVVSLPALAGVNVKESLSGLSFCLI